MEMLKQSSIILLLIIFTCLKSFASPLFQTQFMPQELRNKISTYPIVRSSFATDYGNLSTCSPAAVFYPSTPKDITALIQFSYKSLKPFTISQWGGGNSLNGQTFNPLGVIIDISSVGHSQVNSRINVTNGPVPYADAGAEQTWVDVLNATIKQGLTPLVFPDNIGLSVGGTLTDAGISGGAFKHGPPTSNVYELDVLTGRLTKHC